MAAHATGCPVHAGFDPLDDAFLRELVEHEEPGDDFAGAFGRGIRLRIGSALGRFEPTLALAALTRRFPAPRLAPPEQEIPFHPNISLRGPQQLWGQA
jgi:hypothetical protein